MRVVALSVMAALAATGVRPQCITQYDDMVPAPYVDLGHILPFSLRLFKELLPRSGNYLFSPYSIWNALVMTYFGTNGETQTQMERVLLLSNKEETLALYKSLAQHTLLYESYENPLNYVFDVGNGVCVQNKNLLRDCVGRILSRGLQTVDFHKADGAAVTINQFINKTSRAYIPPLIRPYNLNYGEMMLINSLYFNGHWHKRFDTERTKLERFTTTKYKRYFVEMMSQEGEFRTGISEDLDAQVLELPFKGKRAFMYVFLPENHNTGRELENLLLNLSEGTLIAAIRTLDRRDVKISFPKFKYEKCIGMELRLALERMGIRDLFQQTADLTAFFPAGGLMVKDEIHKAKFEVDEDGEAPVRSKFQRDRTTGAIPALKPFHCNRPFFYVIMDSVTNNLLFMGVFRHP